MKTDKSFVVFWSLIIAVAGSIVLYNLAYPSGTWRYRLTVNIETPEGLKSGSAVREVRVKAKGPFSLSDVQPSKEISGEAVIVDLGDRGKLFALVDTDDWQIVTKTFPGHGALTPRGIRYYNSLDDERATVPWEAYPRIVAFKDINDPLTVFEPFKVIFGRADQPMHVRNTAKRVEDNLDEFFGSGVKLKDITVEMTHDRVTVSSIDKILPWLPDYYSKRLDGQRFGTYKSQHKTANSLSSGAFLAK